jgi:putative heme-binding domain-containing protein
MAFARDEKAPVEVRVAAVEAVGRLKPPGALALVESLIAAATARRSSSPAAEAAVRALPFLTEARGRLAGLVSAPDVPLGLRREALRLSARQNDDALRIIELARSGKLPADLKTEATTVLNTHPDGRVREAAARVLPLPTTAAGRPLPPFFELVRREGNAERGRAVFYRTGTGTNACSSCHRVQGRGRWVGPDLSTIGTKYGKDELLRSIVNPSAAVGYNYRSFIVALADGRVITGLPVDEAADLLVLKTAEGERLRLRTAEIEDRRQSEISLMPENLAQTMSDQDLVDLLAFLSTLRQPVSDVGLYHVLGPVTEGSGAPALDPKAKVDPSAPVRAADGQMLSWRRVTANAESLVDLAPLVGTEASRAAYLYAPIVSPAAQEARLVLDTKADVRVWLDGRPVELSTSGEDSSRSAHVRLPKGTSTLLIRVAGGPDAALVTTFVAARPLEFSPAEAAKVSTR